MNINNPQKYQYITIYLQKIACASTVNDPLPILLYSSMNAVLY